MKGVPFDILATKGHQKILFELKGSLNSWSRPGKTQFARIGRLFDGLRKKRVEIDFYLLQINLGKNDYRLWDTDGLKSLLTGIDTSLGMKTPIEPVVEWVMLKL